MNSASRPPRLLILTQFYLPEMGAPQARLSELGEMLVDRGWRVEVLTALPNYPTGKVLAGYPRWTPVVETIGRIRAVRVPLFPSKSSLAKRLVTYLSFAGCAAALGPFFAHRPDLLYVESPPLFIGYAAWALSTIWRAPYVLNVSDLWPASAIRMGLVAPGATTAAAERLECSLYRKAAAVTGQSSEIVEWIRGKCLGKKTEVITNGVLPERFGRDKATEEARALLGREAGPVFVYAGLLGWAQGVGQILEVAKRLPDAVPGRFVLVGDGPERERLERMLREERITRVKMVGAQERSRIPAILACADVAFITLGMSIPGAVPSKIYEAMASELPVLLLADGEAARRVHDAGCGIAVSPGDVSGAIDACVRLATSPELRRDLGARGRRAAETAYDRRAIGAKLDRFLRDVLPSGSAVRPA